MNKPERQNRQLKVEVMEEKENTYPPHNRNPQPDGRILKERQDLGYEQHEEGSEIDSFMVYELIDSWKKTIEDLEHENSRLELELTKINEKVIKIATSLHFKDLVETSSNTISTLDNILRVVEKPGGQTQNQNSSQLIPAHRSHASEYWVSGDRNPLKYDVVLTEIFSYLGNTKKCRLALKSCRLVCKTWNIFAARRLKRCYGLVHLGNSRQVAEFTQTMRSSQEFPYSQFAIKGRFLPRFATYFQRFGHHIQGLKLIGKRIYFQNRGRPLLTGDISLHNFTKIISFTPNLAWLELSNLRYPTAYLQQEGYDLVKLPTLSRIVLRVEFLFCPSSIDLETEANAPLTDLALRRIFLTAPLLKTLELELLTRSCLPNVFQAIEHITTLQELIFHSCLTETHLKNLAGCSFHLKTLKMSIHLEDGRLFKTFLTRHSNSIETLDLLVTTCQNRRLTPISLPVFSKLRQLKIISGLNHYDLLLFQRCSDGMENEFPVLKRLWVSSDILDTLFHHGIQTPELESLKCDFQGRIPMHWRTGRFCEIKKAFPKLKTIYAKSPKFHQLNRVFNAGDQIEELFLDSYEPEPNVNIEYENIEYALTGIPGWRMLGLGLPDMKDEPLLTRHIILSFIRKWSEVGMLKMKGLKRLSILCKVTSPIGAGVIKHTTAYVALLALPPLECLTLYNSELSDGCIEDLRKRHKSVIVEKLDEKEVKEFQDKRGFI